MALEPYIDFEMARNWADKCFGNSMIYYLMVKKLVSDFVVYSEIIILSF
jgi:hypothetical protein